MNQSAEFSASSRSGSIPFALLRHEVKITFLWHYLNLPGSPGRAIRSPFREDRKKSFSVYVSSGHERWKDFATGEGGDCIDFFARATRTDSKTAALAVWDLYNGRAPEPDLFFCPAHTDPLRPPPSEEKILWPFNMRAPTEEECRTLGRLRSLFPGAFEVARELGLLYVATHHGVKVWLTTDLARKSAEMRRFDGELFSDGQKSFALYGSVKRQPVGLVTASEGLNRLSKIMLVEGVPDLYAAFQVAIDSPINFRPVCVLGAGANISQGDFGKAHVLIIPHNDQPGIEAAPRWAEQLFKLGASSVEAEYLPARFKDLNEAVSDPDFNYLELLQWTAATTSSKPEKMT